MSEGNDERNNPDDSTRRDFITLTASSMVVVGATCAAWPLVDSLNPSSDVLALSSVELDISSIPLGQSMTFQWRGKPVFVFHRTKEQISSARSVSVTELKDPQRDEDRVKEGHEEFLVTVGVCTHLGCIPIMAQADEYGGGYFCPCHGSHYDTSGRIRKGPAPLNLEVPPYEFLSDTKIKIG